MEKKDKVYYENLYLALLDKMKTSNTKEELEATKRQIELFKNRGLVSNLDNESDSYAVQNSKNYKKFAESNNEYIDALLDNQVSTDDEIRRINGKKMTRKVVKGVVIAGLVIGLIAGLNSCKNKNKNNSAVATTTTTTTMNGESTTVSTSDYIMDETTTGGFYNDYDNGSAVPSMSDAMNGIVINDPTATTTQSNSNNNNNGGNPTTGTTQGTTAVEPTTGTTQGTTSTPTPTVTPTPVPSDGGDTVPTTSAIEPSNTAPSDDRNQRDVVIDDYDGVQPSWIDEDPTQTYPTYFNPTTTTTTVAPTATSTQGVTTTTTTTVAPTATPTPATVAGMPVEEDPTETYETFFNPNKECAKVKTLSLRK